MFDHSDLAVCHTRLNIETADSNSDRCMDVMSSSLVQESYEGSEEFSSSELIQNWNRPNGQIRDN